MPIEISKRHNLKWENILKGKIEDVILKIVKRKNFNLIIVGRVKKHRLSYLKHKISKKTNCNVLFIV